MADPEIEIRAAEPTDYAAIERVAAASDEPTVTPTWPGYLYLEFLAASGTLLVAERGDGILGYTGAMVVGGLRPSAHVTDLFVDPVVHGRGTGGRLLAALMASVEVPDWTVCSSSDPRAMTLYARAGMTPLWPITYADAPLDVDLAERRKDITVGAMAGPEAAALERRWSGRDFTVHYDHWLSRPGASAFRVELAGRSAAAGVVRDGRSGAGRVIDHLAIAPWAEPAATILAAVSSSLVRGGGGGSAVAAVANTAGAAVAAVADPAAATVADRAGAGRLASGAGPRLKLAIPGPNPVLPHLLALGFRILDHDTFGATDPGLVDPFRIVPDPSFG